MKCKLLITPLGEARVREVMGRQNLPESFYQDLIDSAVYDLLENAEEKMRKVGVMDEREYVIAMPHFWGRAIFRLEVDFEERPCEARILGFDFVRHFSTHSPLRDRFRDQSPPPHGDGV